jgi:hypothetical protein
MGSWAGRRRCPALGLPQGRSAQRTTAVYSPRSDPHLLLAHALAVSPALLPGNPVAPTRRRSRPKLLVSGYLNRLRQIRPMDALPVAVTSASASLCKRAGQRHLPVVVPGGTTMGKTRGQHKHAQWCRSVVGAVSPGRAATSRNVQVDQLPIVVSAGRIKHGHQGPSQSRATARAEGASLRRQQPATSIRARPGSTRTRSRSASYDHQETVGTIRRLLVVAQPHCRGRLCATEVGPTVLLAPPGSATVR